MCVCQICVLQSAATGLPTPMLIWRSLQGVHVTPHGFDGNLHFILVGCLFMKTHSCVCWFTFAANIDG